MLKSKIKIINKYLNPFQGKKKQKQNGKKFNAGNWLHEW